MNIDLADFINSDSVKIFSEVALEYQVDNYLSKEEVYEKYKLFCNKNGIGIKNEVHFSRNLKRYLPNISSSHKTIDNQRVYCWINIGFSQNFLEFGLGSLGSLGKSLVYYTQNNLDNNLDNNYHDKEVQNYIGYLDTDKKKVEIKNEKTGKRNWTEKYSDIEPTKLFTQQPKKNNGLKEEIIGFMNAKTRTWKSMDVYVTMDEIITAINGNGLTSYNNEDIEESVHNMLMDGIIYEPMNQKYKLSE